MRSIVLLFVFFTLSLAKVLPNGFSFTTYPSWEFDNPTVETCGPNVRSECNSRNARIKQELPELFSIPGINPANTISLSWGPEDSRSFFDFLPVSNVQVTSEPFLIGVFVHDNSLSNEESVNTNLVLNLLADGKNSSVSLMLDILETPNEGPCPYSPNKVDCADAVVGTFPPGFELQTSEINYQLALVFQEENSIESEPSDNIITQEDRLTAGYLFAQYRRSARSIWDWFNWTTAKRTTKICTTAKSKTTALCTTGKHKTTKACTTAKKTTGQKTTKACTTAKKTTGLKTTKACTTAKRTTKEQTTFLQTTAEQTTQCDSVPSTTQQQRTTAEQTTIQQTTAEQTTIQQTTAEQTTIQQTTAEQTTQKQTTALETTQQRTTAEQTTIQQTTAEQTTVQQTTGEQTTGEHTTAQQTTEEQAI